MLEYLLNFSTWTYVWFVAYYFKLTNFNPKLFILFGIIENIIGTGILYKNKKININEEINLPIHIIIKYLMFYLVQDKKYELKDFMAGVIYYIIYNIYLKLYLNVSIFEFYNKKIKNI